MYTSKIFSCDQRSFHLITAPRIVVNRPDIPVFSSSSEFVREHSTHISMNKFVNEILAFPHLSMFDSCNLATGATSYHVFRTI